jgi:glycerol-3-phosphate dehydrogenase (NAD(P)+)
MSTIAVLGAGSWGSALAIHLSVLNSESVYLWGHNKQHVLDMLESGSNKRYLPNINFSSNLIIEHDLKKFISVADIILIAVPSHAFGNILHQIHKLGFQGDLIWATKGFEYQTGRLLHEVLEEVYTHSEYAILSGPTFATEVALGMPTAVTLASSNLIFAKTAAKLFHGKNFRVYTSNDVIGVEVGGAVKNVMAIAAGIIDGLGFGSNARAALITRGLVEMTRLGLALGGKRETFMGLAGLGDLTLTCTDNQSRNRRFGIALGEGKEAKIAHEEIGQVVEGEQSAFEVQRVALDRGIEMPITKCVCSILNGEITPSKAVELLFSREQKQENIF